MSKKKLNSRNSKFPIIVFGILLLSDAYGANSVERIFAPRDKQQCEAAWNRNNDSADQLLEEAQACSESCANEAVSRIGNSGYSSVCGGSVSVQSEDALAGYKKCIPIHRQWDEFLKEKKKAYDNCLQAVENVRAAEIVLRASEDESRFPREMSGARRFTEEANSRITTRNPVVDRYREKVQERTTNATSSLVGEGLEDLSRGMNGNQSIPRSAHARCRNVRIEERESCLYKNLREGR